MDPKKFKVRTGHFSSTTDEEKAKLLEERNAKNTNKATKSSLKALTSYLIEKELRALCDILDDDLPELLLNFYTDLRTIKGNELYNTQTLKRPTFHKNKWNVQSHKS